jgi:phosphoenolpyruvate carboxylase
MSDIDARLREDVHLLGELLGNTIREQYGDDFLDKIEQIRKGAKADRRGAAAEQAAGEELSASLNQLQENELLPVARAFNQFLNLANIAEQYQLIHRRDESQPAPFESRVLPELLARLQR